jgi:hypothetical protein
MKNKTTWTSTGLDNYIMVDMRDDYNKAVLEVIDKLLSLPFGEQLYCKEIKILFSLLKT